MPSRRSESCALNPEVWSCLAGRPSTLSWWVSIPTLGLPAHPVGHRAAFLLPSSPPVCWYVPSLTQMGDMCNLFRKKVRCREKTGPRKHGSRSENCGLIQAFGICAAGSEVLRIAAAIALTAAGSFCHGVPDREHARMLFVPASLATASKSSHALLNSSRASGDKGSSAAGAGA
jgi:hypothetical protein